MYDLIFSGVYAHIWWTFFPAVIHIGLRRNWTSIAWGELVTETKEPWLLFIIVGWLMLL